LDPAAVILAQLLLVADPRPAWWGASDGVPPGAKQAGNRELRAVAVEKLAAQVRADRVRDV